MGNNIFANVNSTEGIIDLLPTTEIIQEHYCYHQSMINDFGHAERNQAIYPWRHIWLKIEAEEIIEKEDRKERFWLISVTLLEELGRAEESTNFKRLQLRLWPENIDSDSDSDPALTPA